MPTVQIGNQGTERQTEAHARSHSQQVATWELPSALEYYRYLGSHGPLVPSPHLQLESPHPTCSHIPASDPLPSGLVTRASSDSLSETSRGGLSSRRSSSSDSTGLGYGAYAGGPRVCGRSRSPAVWRPCSCPFPSALVPWLLPPRPGVVPPSSVYSLHPGLRADLHWVDGTLDHLHESLPHTNNGPSQVPLGSCLVLCWLVCAMQ